MKKYAAFWLLAGAICLDAGDQGTSGRSGMGAGRDAGHDAPSGASSTSPDGSPGGSTGGSTATIGSLPQGYDGQRGKSFNDGWKFHAGGPKVRRHAGAPFLVRGTHVLSTAEAFGCPSLFDLRARQSVLSLITDKRERVLAGLGAADKVRLGEHFDQIRDLETRLAAMPPTAGDQCQKPTAPADNLMVGGNNAGSSSDEIGTDTGYSDEDARSRMLADLIHMAFACDITRVATLQITVFQSHMNVFKISTDFGVPIKADLHECGHNGDATTRGQLPVSMCLGWHIGHYAYLMDKLKKTPEGAGTVLDNSVMVFMPEAGHGVQLNDAMTDFATHSVDRMVLLVGGGTAGGLKPGRHIIAPDGTHPGNVLISAMQAAGYTDDKFGEVSGKFADVFG